MADAEQRVRKRDRFKARTKRFVELPLSLRTSDLPRRAASAVIMLAISGAALGAGGVWFDTFIIVVALACFGEFARLVLRAVRQWHLRIAGLAAGGGYIGLAAMVLIEIDNRALLLLLVMLVICVDTFAYFFGRTIGGPKIAPRISPSKTWAGLLGGIVGASIVLILYQLFDGSGSAATRTLLSADLAFLVLAGAMVAICAQSGDFFESWLKRRAHMKDSSRLIPGHGGVFDRFDGMLPVAIIFGGLILTQPSYWSPA